MSIDEIIEHTLSLEQGYVNNPNDRGGPTNYGITQATAKENGYTGDMRNITKQQAIDIYKNKYFIKPKFDMVYLIDQDIAAKLFDMGVNLGPATASKFLQRSLNLLNNKNLYNQLSVDGMIGNGTLNGLKLFMGSQKDSKELMLKSLNGFQFMRYADIVEKDQSQKMFIIGWIRNRIS